MGRYRLLVGRAIVGGKTYRAPAVIETDTDLSVHNTPGSTKFEVLDGGRKFRSGGDAAALSFPGGQVHDGKQVAIQDGGSTVDQEGSTDNLESMTDAELRQLVADNELTVEDDASREEVIAALRAAPK
jgi:hypothetical protein